MMNRKYTLGLAFLSISVLSSCGADVKSVHVVSSVSTQPGALRPSIAPIGSTLIDTTPVETTGKTFKTNPKSGPVTNPARAAGSGSSIPPPSAVSTAPANGSSDGHYEREITAKITVKKSALLGQDFFYGADLQYSSIYDKSLDLYTQSSAMGHIPAFFRINGSELQLVADNRRLFPSDVNHPERVISKFKILSETADSLVIGEADSAQFLVTTIDPKADSPRDHWARSFQYIQDGDYMMQESSVIMSDGTTAEIMESIFPRASLATSKSFEKFEMDPTDPVGAADGAIARYRFLPGETIFNGEKKLAYAEHFDIGDNKTIDWYATANISDEHLEVAREAVEGWNRYFKTFAGINREVVKFKGRLPVGVKLGDPRYNVINWDSRRVAGAAYESQATDPFTGKQSHSIIYMPVAWFQIGMDYWKNGQYSDAKKTSASLATPPPPKKSFAKLGCERDLSGVGEILNSARLSEVDAKTFSIDLMKQTLFHEVGHALGLAHNFKGSLSFDRSNPKSIFSDSIMDYNDYEVERTAFTTPTSEDGPLLEYDRQALSAIYNKMSDVKKADPVLAACNDEEADTEESGKVDPLCMRYDVEKDPTLSVVTALKRISSAKLPNDVTLAQSLIAMKYQVLTEDALKAADTIAKHKALFKTFESSIVGVMGFYFNTGKESLSRTVRNNIKSLHVFSDDLPKGYSEKAMRERAYKGFETVLAMKDLPAPVKIALKKIITEGSIALQQTPFMKSLSAQDSADLQKLIDSELQDVAFNFVKSESKGLVKLKTTVLATLMRVPALPLFFGSAEGTAYDFEKNIVSRVFEVVTDVSRSDSERLAAAKVLASYSDRGIAPKLIVKAHAALQAELAAAKENDAREFSQEMTEILK